MIKKGDFIELDYTGRLKDDKIVFDTTVEQVAKDNKILNPKYKYAPVIVCIGEKHLVAGLDDALVGKNPGKYTIEVKAEHAFGKKTAELLKLIPKRLFSKDEVQPFVGLEVNVDGSLGIVRSVSGGRVIVDFNHPLASKDLVYDVEVKRIVIDPLEKTRALLELMAVPFDNIDIVDNKAEVTLKTALPPKEIIKGLSESLTKLAGLKHVEFKTKQEVKKELKEEIKKEKAEEKKAEEKKE
ncbi:peptidylprolyl isomerase [Candidatus Woesearchaeota archaeon]|nr:peptidylprolyl isomerase [Candidatus Woesearchaeota archaeon]